MRTTQPFATSSDLRTFDTRQGKRYPLNLTFDLSHMLVLAPAGAGMSAIAVLDATGQLVDDALQAQE